MPDTKSHWRTNKKIFKYSKDLSRSMTDAENCLWQALRSYQVSDIHFRRQHAIGPYIVDFCSPRCKLVIEVDGGQHVEQEKYDEQRTQFLEKLGYRVLRFWNDEVERDLDAVLEVIWEAIDEPKT